MGDPTDEWPQSLPHLAYVMLIPSCSYTVLQPGALSQSDLSPAIFLKLALKVTYNVKKAVVTTVFSSAIAVTSNAGLLLLDFTVWYQ